MVPGNTETFIIQVNEQRNKLINIETNVNYIQHNVKITVSPLQLLCFYNICKSSLYYYYYHHHHPPLVLEFKLIFHSQYTMLVPQHNYGKGDDLLLYDTLLNSDWSCVLNEISVDSAVNNLTATVSEAIDLAIPFVKPNNST
jgi:hypothetical protein